MSLAARTHAAIAAVLRDGGHEQVLHEVGLEYGARRADLFIVAWDCLHGHEVKTAEDRLGRLDGQVEAYSGVCDRCTLWVDERHLSEAQKLVPSWWGVVVITGYQPLRFEHLRPAMPHPRPAVLPALMLLWKEEVRELARELGRFYQRSKWSREKLCRALAEEVPPEELRLHVRAALLRRRPWLVDRAAPCTR